MKDMTFGAPTHHWMGATFRIVTSHTDSGGTVGVFDSTAPVGFGPPRHIHLAEDEVLMVLTGEIEWLLDGATGRAGPGDALFIPRNTEHAWRVIGAEPCRHIVMVTPGGFEGFFVEMAEGGYSIPEDMEAVSESAARHNLVFTGPPLD